VKTYRPSNPLELEQQFAHLDRLLKARFHLVDSCLTYLYQVHWENPCREMIYSLAKVEKAQVDNTPSTGLKTARQTVVLLPALAYISVLLEQQVTVVMFVHGVVEGDLQWAQKEN